MATATDRDRRVARWLYPLLTGLLAIWLLGYQIHQHGRTLDDKVQRDRGAATMGYVTSLDARYLPPPDLEDFSRGDPLYGPFGAVTALAAGTLLAPLVGDPAVVRHLEFSAGLTCWFLLLFYCVQCLGRRFVGSTAGGVLAGLAFLATPRVVGLATCNPSDLPAAAAAALMVLCLLRWLDTPTWRRASLVSVTLAATAAVRPQNGALLVPVAAVFVVPWFLRQEDRRRLGAQLLAAPILTYLLWIVLWPDFWLAPLEGPLRVVRGFLVEGHRYTQGTLWFGEPAHGPKLYSIVWLGMTTPLWILAAATLGVATSRRNPLLPGMLAWCVISVGKHLSGLGNFGGIRHFLDAFVPLALFAAAGFSWSARRLAPKLATPLALVGLAAAALYSFTLQPFQSSYFNELVGGARGAAGRFDLEPNGASMLRLMRELAPRLDEKSAILVTGPADLVRQIPLPEGLPVHELLPDNVELLTTDLGRAALRGRRVFLVTVQDRGWGKFDRFLSEGVLRTIVTQGPGGLPVGLAMQVMDDRFYQRAGEIFR